MNDDAAQIDRPLDQYGDECMQAVIDYGMAVIRNEPRSGLDFDIVMKAIDAHSDVLGEYARLVPGMYMEWLGTDDPSETEDVVIHYVRIANNAYAFDKGMADLYERAERQARDAFYTAMTQKHEARHRVFMDGFRGHIDLVATLVNTPFWLHCRDKFREPYPWWLGQEAIDAVDNLKR